MAYRDQQQWVNVYGTSICRDHTILDQALIADDDVRYNTLLIPGNGIMYQSVVHYVPWYEYLGVVGHCCYIYLQGWVR